MPADLFLKWSVWDSVEPFGDHRRDLQAAYIAAASLAPWSKRPKAPKAGDYLPSMRPAPGQAVQSMEAQKDIFARAKKGFERALEKQKK